MASRITETELVLPSLYLMEQNGNSITTTELISGLREIMNPTGEDLEILKGRKDDKFSQKVRNLKAHNTFERFGYAEYKKGMVTLTDTGRKYLKDRADILKYLLTNDFEYPVLKQNLRKIQADPRKIETYDENIIIREGMKNSAEVAVYQRSKRLRDYALRYFKEKNGELACSCCTFNFSDFYGEEIGRGFIEIHHVNPIFNYEGEDYEKTFKEAVTNLVPVCSNCHRMIHRNGNKPLEIQVLIDIVNNNGIFRRFEKQLTEKFVDK